MYHKLILCFINKFIKNKRKNHFVIADNIVVQELSVYVYKKHIENKFIIIKYLLSK